MAFATTAEAFGRCTSIGGSRISDLINTFETKNAYKAESSWNKLNTKEKMFEDIEPLENPLPDWERDWVVVTETKGIGSNGLRKKLCKHSLK